MKKRTFIGCVSPPYLYSKFTSCDHAFNQMVNHRRFKQSPFFFYSSFSSIRMAKGGKPEDTARLRTSQRFSMGLRSGQNDGHPTLPIPFLSRKSSKMAALWGHVLSSIKTKVLCYCRARSHNGIQNFIQIPDSPHKIPVKDVQAAAES